MIKHIEALNRSLKSPPLTYWGNTSGNTIIRELAERADQKTKDMIEQAMLGEEIAFPAKDHIVFDDLYQRPENILNVMLYTGYLTAVGFDGVAIRARIPNKEVQKIYRDQIRDWFSQAVKTFDVLALYSAMEQGDAERIEEILTEEFLSAVNYYDSSDAFYHEVMLMLMRQNRNFLCESNWGSDTGSFGIISKRRSRWDLAFVLGVTLSEKTSDMFSDVMKGIKQIAGKHM